MIKILLLVGFGLGVFLSHPASAQTQQQRDQLENWARYTVITPMCEKLGMEIAPDTSQQIDHVVQEQVASWNLPVSVTDYAKRSAVERQSRMLEIDLQTASNGARTTQQLRDVRQIFITYGSTCLEAANDPIFSRFIVVPTGFSLENAATQASDELLVDGGLASWQTPLITARGDMVTLAAACRSRIGAVRSDELRELYGRSDVPRERTYYDRAFDMGLADGGLQDLDSTQCARAIGRYRQRIATLGN